MLRQVVRVDAWGKAFDEGLEGGVLEVGEVPAAHNAAVAGVSER